MPAINYEWLKKSTNNNKINENYPVFIETGTFYGKTILHMEQFFTELYTVEIKKSFYENVKNKYQGDKINFYFGDSSKVLEKICKKVNKNSIFFLDGHWSRCGTGKGDKDVPLYEELINIVNYFNQSSIIIIDDCRLFNTGPTLNNGSEDWVDINTEKILNFQLFYTSFNHNL